MKIRTIKPSFWHDEALGELEANARFTFVGVICLADDEGRLRARPEYVKSQLFAYDESVTTSDVRRYLDALHEAGVIRLYGTGRQLYAEVVNFGRHQRIRRPYPSELPPPSKKYPTIGSFPIEGADMQGETATSRARDGHEPDKCQFNNRTDRQEVEREREKEREEEDPHHSNASPAPAHTREAADDDDRPGRAAILEPTVNAGEWVERIGAKLAGVMRGDTAGVAEQLFLAHRRPHPTEKRRYELAKWEAAVDAFIERVRQGRAPDGSPVGYIIGMVPGAGVSVEINPAVVGIDAAAGGELSEEARAVKWDEAIAAARGEAAS